MTPKEKAKDLVEKMSFDWDMCRGQNKICAIITVDQILAAFNPLEYYPEDLREYWQQVKIEIENI